MTTYPTEVEFRRRWFESHHKRYAADEPYVERSSQSDRGFALSATEALELLARLARTADVEEFRARLQEWAVKPTTLAFNGFSGQMMVNQLVKRSDDKTALAELLTDCLTIPSSAEEAAGKLHALVDYVESIRVGAHPAPGHVSFLLSYFWALRDGARWPVIWPSAVGYLETATGEPLPSKPADRYRRYCVLLDELAAPYVVSTRVADWWTERRPVFLDPVLMDRAAFGRHADGLDAVALQQNARALISVAGYMGAELADAVSKAAGRSLQHRRPRTEWAPGRPRSDFWVDWIVPKTSTLGLRMWVNENGAALGLRVGEERPEWTEDVDGIVSSHSLVGFERLATGDSKLGRDVGFVGGWPGNYVYAHWFDRDAASAIDVRAEMERATLDLRPLLDALVVLATGERPPHGEPADPLAPLVEGFRTDQHYPTPADEAHEADRRQFAELLRHENVALIAVEDLRQIHNTGRYGNPGPQSVLNISLRDADAAEYDRILASVEHLLWGDGEDSKRIDDLLSDEQYEVKGLRESVIMKLLAICKPDRYIPVFPYGGPKGKLGMIRKLGLREPMAPTRGELQVEANDILRERIDKFFPGDPWGMMRFLYWYLEREDEPAPQEIEPLDTLAEELLLDRSFVDDVVALLEDKGQVIFYGPPGTGKTYFARRLAEALVTDPSRRLLVQFHPSSSHEDFFEGYRPEIGAEGEMVYRLSQGPLARIAAQALAAPGKRHVMVIDEINRANLPRVLGELLFLLEYRDEQIRTLYRPEDPFELPHELWFIATMNTADRSIALIDAALRRRFHFVPFFPNRWPIDGLLDRWLQRHDEPAWVGELVAMVNDELIEALGGPHLQLGPSNFMKHGVDGGLLRRIWIYNVEPFIEDQFFGNPAQIDYFRFDAVYRRYRVEAGLDELESLQAGMQPVVDSADGDVEASR